MSKISFNPLNGGIEHWELKYHNNKFSEIQRFNDSYIGKLTCLYSGDALVKIISTDINDADRNFTLEISYQNDGNFDTVLWKNQAAEALYKMTYKGAKVKHVDKLLLQNGNWEPVAQYLYNYEQNKLKLRVLGELEYGSIYPSYYTRYEHNEEGAMMSIYNEAFASHQNATKYFNYSDSNFLIGTIEHFYHPDKGILAYKPEENYSVDENKAMASIKYPLEVFELFEILPEMPFNEIVYELMLILSDRKVFEVNNEENQWLYQFEYEQLTEQDNTQNRLRSLHIYPNPATTLIHIPKAFQGESFRIFTTTGQEIMNVKKDMDILNIEHLEAGHYWLQLIGQKGEIHNLRFVKIG